MVEYAGLGGFIMRIVGAIFILVGFLISLSIVGAVIGVPMMFIELVMIVLGGRRKTIITNVVQVSNVVPEQRYVPDREAAPYVPEVRQVGARNAPLLGQTIDITPPRQPAFSEVHRVNANADDYDRKKWQALVKYDPDIAKVATKLRELGDHWVDEFAKSYLAINDKSYLPTIVNQIISDARKQQSP